MEKFLDRKRLNRLKQQYRTGKQVEIEVKSGTEGEEVVTETATIKKVDDAGGIHVYIKGEGEAILIPTQNKTMLLDSEYSREEDTGNKNAYGQRKLKNDNIQTPKNSR